MMCERDPIFLAPKRRLLFGALAVSLALAVLAGAVSISFLFESSTILYKSGTDRLLLRSGQVIGLATGGLLVLQIVSGARFKCLDRIFGLNRLYRIHRITGFIIACLAIAHPILIFTPEDRISIPLQWRYWPEFVGLFLLLLILAMVISSNWRGRLGLAFHRWWLLHRAGAMLVAGAFGVHVLFVSDTFDQKPPRLVALCTLGFCGLVFFWLRIRPLWNRRKAFVVSDVKPAGSDAIYLKLVPGTDHIIPAHAPGQFSFISLLSPGISREEHPLSIVSSPTRPACVEFLVRTTGDWTAKLADLQPGDRVSLHGPFGRFSHLRILEPQEIVMIAGGIGITPMLSMLRYMADHGDRRKITLIWSNRSQRHIVYPQELAELSTHLEGLHIHHILTRDPDSEAEKARLDRPKLERLLADCRRSSAVFICGPDRMMKKVYDCLVLLGFSRRRIFMERFSL